MANRWNYKQANATVFTSLKEANEVAATLKDHPVYKTGILEVKGGWVIEREHLEHFGYYLYLKYNPPKPKPVVLPDEVWVDAYITHNLAGSITHVSYGSKFFATEAECQNEIDTRPGWIGGGGPKAYRPIRLVKG